MKKRISRLLALLLATLTLCAAFASCSAGNKSDATEDYFGGSFEEEKMPTVDAGNGFVNTEQNITQAPDTQRKVIKTFDINAETKDFDAAITSLGALITSCNAYVESSSSTNKSLGSSSTRYARHATYTVRVPAENAERFVNSLGEHFNVTSNRSFVEDVSESYYSIEARLEELKVERDSLLDILDDPNTKKDYTLWTTVQSRLSEVRQQIAVYQGQLNRYDSKIAYSTVNLSVNEVINYTEGAENNSFGSRLGAAFKEGWVDFLSGVQEFVIWFAEALPVLLLLGIIAAVTVTVIVHATKKKNR